MFFNGFTLLMMIVGGGIGFGLARLFTPLPILDERTYCEVCEVNFDEDGFDYRFECPICLECAYGVLNYENTFDTPSR
jgi:hypothetical protein